MDEIDYASLNYAALPPDSQSTCDALPRVTVTSCQVRADATAGPPAQLPMSAERNLGLVVWSEGLDRTRLPPHSLRSTRSATLAGAPHCDSNSIPNVRCCRPVRAYPHAEPIKEQQKAALLAIQAPNH